MNSLFWKRLLLAAATVIVAAEARADGVELSRVLHGPPGAGHVIDLMLRHGINRDGPADRLASVHHSPLGSMWIPGNELGDLQLVEIAEIPSADLSCPPTYAVVVQNNSTRDVCGFRVSLVALFGRIVPSSPTTIVKVDKVCAGQAVEVQVQMPAESLAMGTRLGKPCEFQRVVVAVDSFDQFVEVNEANNVKVFDRTAIATREVVQAEAATLETTATEVAAQSTVDAGETAVAAPQAAAPETATPAPPASNDLKSAIDKLDMQGLGRNGAQTTAARIAS
jgi:hypothetical protein